MRIPLHSATFPFAVSCHFFHDYIWRIQVDKCQSLFPAKKAAYLLLNFSKLVLLKIYILLM